MLLGASTVSGLFTDDVLRMMGKERLHIPHARTRIQSLNSSRLISLTTNAGPRTKIVSIYTIFFLFFFLFYI